MRGEGIVARVVVPKSPKIAAIVEFVDGSEATIQPCEEDLGGFFVCGMSGRYSKLEDAVEAATKARERQVDRAMENAGPG